MSRSKTPEKPQDDPDRRQVVVIYEDLSGCYNIYDDYVILIKWFKSYGDCLNWLSENGFTFHSSIRHHDKWVKSSKPDKSI